MTAARRRGAASPPATEAAAELTRTADLVAGELARADGKAGTLLGLVGAAAAVLTTVGSGRHLGYAAPAVWTADAALAAAALLLLAAIRPTLVGGSGWMAYATMAPGDILAAATRHDDHAHHAHALATHVSVLTRLARRKYRAIRYAVHLVAAAGALLAAALATAALTR